NQYLRNMGKVLLFNPWSAHYGWRIPNSVLQIAASIEGKFQYALVDGNREKDPWPKIKAYLDTGEFDAFGCTVMPGPQLRQAIPITKQIKQHFPGVTTIWGGYFPSNQYKACLQSGWVDYIVDGPGDNAFPALMRALGSKTDVRHVHNLIFVENGEIVKTGREELIDQDTLPQLPYTTLDSFYSMKGY